MDCDAAVAAVYALPSLTEAAAAYGLGFALVFIPWLWAWIGRVIVDAIRLSRNV